MNWYYAVGAEHKGPVAEEEFRRLVQQGVITSQTLVWREGMANWQPHGGSAPLPPISPGPTSDGVICAGCGRTFAAGEVVSLSGSPFCAACKPMALQRLREGATASSAVEETRREYLKHEASVKSIGLLYYLGGAALLLLGMSTLITATRLGTRPSGSEAAGALVGSALFLILGLGQIWVGTGLRRLKRWARVPTGILSGLGLLGFPLGTLINGYILYLVFSRKGRMVFSDEYRAVIEQTPHIKYRTSIVVWILLGLVLFLIGVGLLSVLFFARR